MVYNTLEKPLQPTTVKLSWYIMREMKTNSGSWPSEEENCASIIIWNEWIVKYICICFILFFRHGYSGMALRTVDNTLKYLYT